MLDGSWDAVLGGWVLQRVGWDLQSLERAGDPCYSSRKGDPVCRVPADSLGEAAVARGEVRVWSVS